MTAVFAVQVRLVTVGPSVLSTVLWAKLPALLAAQVVTGVALAAAFQKVYRHDM